LEEEGGEEGIVPFRSFEFSFDGAFGGIGFGEIEGDNLYWTSTQAWTADRRQPAAERLAAGGFKFGHESIEHFGPSKLRPRRGRRKRLQMRSRP
jgi:hypothetical protein